MLDLGWKRWCGGRRLGFLREERSNERDSCEKNKSQVFWKWFDRFDGNRERDPVCGLR